MWYLYNKKELENLSLKQLKNSYYFFTEWKETNNINEMINYLLTI